LKKILEENIRKVKLSTPDYRDMDPQQAIEDFRQRRENYQRVYEPVDDELDGRVPHIKIINSRKFIGTTIGKICELPIFISSYQRCLILLFVIFLF
jgi:6-phosphofructo-2-kinase